MLLKGWELSHAASLTRFGCEGEGGDLEVGFGVLLSHFENLFQAMRCFTCEGLNWRIWR